MAHLREINSIANVAVEIHVFAPLFPFGSEANVMGSTP
jgi:hypothetical protein